MVGEFCDSLRNDDEARESALAAQYRVLLWLAFRAGDAQRFGQAWAWLAPRRPEMLASVRTRAMCALVGLPVIRNATLGALDMVVSVKRRIEFHGVDARGLE